ncbi:fructosamine kinase family protein [Pararhodospirillum oryzae]|uniref:Aminoglycoside phosphotransferase n=1 Tax=Pararhodospirillum oryzae TaxID=478448 RepID=A0A512H9B7_9PROT|nr:fructosamine kinase family protein [Pararhodospirillum oryzae]GEO81990.1 aminoglycoside phosphotransferase [Pararhodospirillum oryzae]
MNVSVPHAETVARLLGAPVQAGRPLGGGCVAQVWGLTLADGRRVVLKSGAGLGVEARMLRCLAGASVPVPAVLAQEGPVLLMDWVEAGGALNGTAQADLARILAALHARPQPCFGFDEDTVIGGLVQPNPRTTAWIPFFAGHRLIDRARRAREAGTLPAGVLARVERLAGRVERWLLEPDHPSLIHGDVWGGNVLCAGGRVTALIDPALYYAHPEIELAFGTLFGTLGPAFFRAYEALRPIAPGFFEERRDLYLLYPLLVHVELFGDAYVGQVEAVLTRYGA